MAYPPEDHVMLASAARTTSGSSNTIGLGETKSAYVFFDITAVSGTLPTMTVVFYDSPDGGTTWYAFEVLDPVIQTTGQFKKRLIGYGEHIKFDYTLAGTNPSFTFSTRVYAKYEY